MQHTNMKKNLLLLGLLVWVSGAVAQTCNPAIPAAAPDSRYLVRGEEVIDTQTQLIWQHCPLGQTGDDCAGGQGIALTWQEALQAADDERNSTGLAWRLPSIKELETLVEPKCYDPAINETVFPKNGSLRFWSASPMLLSTKEDKAGIVGFVDGYTGDGSKRLPRGVRLVRDGLTR